VGASGSELMAAIALAYEVQCSVCDAASIRARGWDHVTYGAFSTALACARLMKLDPQKTRHAVNIAGVACAAMRQSRAGELSHWKGVGFADAARRGVYSALLARTGMTGPAPIFEGQMAFEKQLGVSLGNVGEKFKGAPEMILNTRVEFTLRHAKNPLKDSEVEEKFFALVEPAIGKNRGKKIVDLAWKLDEASNVDELMKALVMPERNDQR